MTRIMFAVIRDVIQYVWWCNMFRAIYVMWNLQIFGIIEKKSFLLLLWGIFHIVFADCAVQYQQLGKTVMVYVLVSCLRTIIRQPFRIKLFVCFYILIFPCQTLSCINALIQSQCLCINAFVHALILYTPSDLFCILWVAFNGYLMLLPPGKVVLVPWLLGKVVKSN